MAKKPPIELEGTMPPDKRGDLRRAIASALNQASAENPSGTPDFILAAYLMDALDAYDKAVRARGQWRGQPAEFYPTPASEDSRVDDPKLPAPEKTTQIRGR